MIINKLSLYKSVNSDNYHFDSLVMPCRPDLFRVCEFLGNISGSVNLEIFVRYPRCAIDDQMSITGMEKGHTGLSL
jgi:hypothetical protein